MDIIKQGIKRYGNHSAVACSFGKDSMVVLYMALRVNPDIKVIFNNSGVEFPETIRIKNRLKSDWNLNLIETKPDKTFLVSLI
jgi:phosphoadenosine phosphosulfate reductase